MSASPYTWHRTEGLRKRKPREGENPDVPVYQQQWEHFELDMWKRPTNFKYEWRDIEWGEDNDIPEVGEEWFKKAKLILPEKK